MPSLPARRPCKRRPLPCASLFARAFPARSYMLPIRSTVFQPKRHGSRAVVVNWQHFQPNSASGCCCNAETRVQIPPAAVLFGGPEVKEAGHAFFFIFFLFYFLRPGSSPFNIICFLVHMHSLIHSFDLFPKCCLWHGVCNPAPHVGIARFHGSGFTNWSLPLRVKDGRIVWICTLIYSYGRIPSWYPRTSAARCFVRKGNQRIASKEHANLIAPLRTCSEWRTSGMKAGRFTMRTG